MKNLGITSLILSFLFSNSFAAEFWVDGKDHPEARVNVNMKALSPDVYTRVADRVNEAVVNISSTQTIKHSRGRGGMRGRGRGPEQSPFNFPFDFFGDNQNPFEGPAPDHRAQSAGSGFILNSEGYVVTNNHVVANADEIKVILHDESEYIAKVIGKDPKIDVALLKITAKKKLPGVILGDSDRLKVGEPVIAIGNPFGFSHSVTQGIVSAKGRSVEIGPYDAFIQTDAAINPGNSGGPLLNLYGEVIGINAAIISGGGGNVGIGFAIPINLARNSLLQLKEKGKVTRSWLGVVIQKVTEEHATALKLPNRNGALVSEVQKGSPAAKVGIKAGDVIVKFDGKEIKDWHDLPITVATTAVNKTVRVDVLRDGVPKVFEVQVAELKDDEKEATKKDEGTGADTLGLAVKELTPELAKSMGLSDDSKGVVVSDVDESKTAASRGVRPGDLILEVNRKKITSLADYRTATAKLKTGNTVLLLIKRGAQTLFIAFTL